MILIELFIQVLASVILTEALTELAVKSEIFQPLRAWLFTSKYTIFRFIHRIFDCGYCFSVWAAALSIVCVFYLDNPIIYFLVLVLVIHRLSNLFHFIIDAVRDVFRP